MKIKRSRKEKKTVGTQTQEDDIIFITKNSITPKRTTKT